jgi:serine/threonine protein kinase
MSATIQYEENCVKKYAKSHLEDDMERHGVERAIYTRLGHHPRILRCLQDDNNSDGDPLVFSYLKHGSLARYLVNHRPDPPLELRVCWIQQIAEGITHIHSHDIVWVDCHLGNVLLTDDLDVVLSDFAGSALHPSFYSVLPPPIYTAPSLQQNLFGVPAHRTHDIFAFAICAHILLFLRFPHRRELYRDDYLCATTQEYETITKLHSEGCFVAVSGIWGDILHRCWRGEYDSMQDVQADLEVAAQGVCNEQDALKQPLSL